MIFRLTDKPLKEEHPELSQFPKLNACTDKQLRYIFLAYDYDSPFRRLPREDWREKALLRAGFKYEPDGKRLDKNARDILSHKVQSVNEGLREFMELQYDEDKDLLEAVTTQMRQFSEFLKKPDKDDNENEQARKILKDLPDLKRKQNELRKSIESSSQEMGEELDEIESLSTIDKLALEEQRDQ